MEREELLKLKVTDLRAMAENYEDVKGAAGMSKDELVHLVAEKEGIDLVDHVPEGIGRHEHKVHIREMKALRDKALEAGDRETFLKARRRLKFQKRDLRKTISQALRDQKRASGRHEPKAEA